MLPIIKRISKKTNKTVPSHNASERSLHVRSTPGLSLTTEKICFCLLANLFLVLHTMRHLHGLWPAAHTRLIMPNLSAWIVALVICSMFVFPAITSPFVANDRRHRGKSIANVIIVIVLSASPLISCFATQAIFCSVRGIVISQ